MCMLGHHKYKLFRYAFFVLIWLFDRGVCFSEQNSTEESNLYVWGDIGELTVSNEFGLSDSDIVLVRLTPKVESGFVISNVSGNTATVGATAKISVALTREPQGIVTIPIKSSDPLEGELLSNSISFSQVDWSVPQVVSVIGTNPDVINGEQDYRIVLGPVVSTDISYDGLDPEDIEIRGLSLTVRDSQPIVFVSNIKQRFRPKYERNREGEVTYSILSAEPGISIDKYDGTLEWTPPQASQGGLYEVEIESSLSG